MQVPKSNVVPFAAPGAAPTLPPAYLAMAMAQMKAEGKLGQPDTEPKPTARKDR